MRNSLKKRRLQAVERMRSAVPLLGREAESGRGELLLSRDRYGYIAKYRWLPAEDVVLILAVRHQGEAGYVDDSGS
jgi:plasmid stabilization system protein ParE